MDDLARPTPSSSELKSCCAGLYELPITTILLGPSFHPGGPALTRRLAAAALVGRDSRVLDVASGTGESARVIAEHTGCRVMGLDYSAKNVAEARRLTAEVGLSDRVRFVQGDAEGLPFDEARFDVVLCECALCTFPSMATALSEMRRVLVCRGRLAVSDIVLNAPVPAELDNVMGHVLCITGALSREGYRAALDAADLGQLRYHDVSVVLSEMIDGIERRIGRAKALAEAGELGLPAGLEAPGSTLRAARAFVRSGGVGYALWTARKPAAAR